jgi:hypothetical protein
MRSVFYGTALVCLLAGLLAFATAPAVAQTSNQLMQKTATTIDKNQSANSGNVGFFGEAKAGASQSPMASSLIDCQRAQLARYCAMPDWALRLGKDRYSPGHDELNSGPLF